MWVIDKFLLLWINDGFMVVFFFYVGLELKWEVCEGEFVNFKDIILFVVGVIGGMVLFVLIYVGINWENLVVIVGWVIFVVIDIVFVLGILVLLGSCVFISFKVFLVMFVIIDDIGVIVIIVLFYIENIIIGVLVIVVGCLLLLW